MNHQPKGEMMDENNENQIDLHNEAHKERYGLHDVDEDGIVDKYAVETYYAQVTQWSIFEGDKFVRVVADNGGTDIEIRLSKEYLETMLRALKNEIGNEEGEK